MSSVSGPQDVVEAFARAYDDWADSVDVNLVDEWRERNRAAIRDLAADVAAAGTAEPARPLLGADDERTHLGLAAIDEALAYCHPRRGAPGSALDHVTKRYRSTGNMLEAGAPTGGGVVPRWTSPVVGEGLTDRPVDAFVNVRRILPHHWHRLRPRRIEPDDDLPLTARRIAFAPLIESLADVEVEQGIGISGRADAAWYSLGPVHDRIRARIPDLLAELDGSGAHVALCPEGALDEVIEDAWRRHLDATPRPAGSDLRWIVLGSGRYPSGDSDRPHSNRAVILHRDTGAPLLAHEKFAPFNFHDRTQLENWGIDHLVTAGPPVLENAYRGRFAELLESRAGRFAVMICEDLTRAGHDIGDAVRASSPSLVFTPVFARKTRAFHWEQQAAGRWWELEGSAVAVCNSLAVPQAEQDKENRRNATTTPLPHDTPFCLLMSPRHHGSSIKGRDPGKKITTMELW